MLKPLYSRVKEGALSGIRTTDIRQCLENMLIQAEDMISSQEWDRLENGEISEISFPLEMRPWREWEFIDTMEALLEEKAQEGGGAVFSIKHVYDHHLYLRLTKRGIPDFEDSDRRAGRRYMLSRSNGQNRTKIVDYALGRRQAATR